SLFAKAMGIKMFAAAGRIQIQAQNDALEMLSKKDMTIVSHDGKVTISAKTELLLACGEAFVRIKDGNVDIGGPGNVVIKCGTLAKQGAATQQASITLPAHCPSMVSTAASGKEAGVKL
ncbi:DUF2345 domain-containing protein, partial [Acerihabitans sp. TG2]|uniref:DUF2345 domain-containing protein n=1 Tax=Acerihabitans sp. TG2 TaxID=3096008 RepID=UPI002B23A529